MASGFTLVANDKQFEQYEMTKSLLFALSCSAFWVGMLNAIQEVCKERSMEGYGTTANLNDLPLKLQQEGVMIPHETEDFFEFTNEHMLFAWGILVLFVIIFLILARIVLISIEKE